MDLESEFGNLSIKFLFVCESSIDLNALLNDLNSLDYKSHQISNTNNILQFIESLTKIPTTSDANIKIKACHLIKQLIIKQKISLPDVISNKIINWILQCNKNSCQNVFACEALDVLALLFKKNSAAAVKHVDMMLSTDGILLNLLKPAESLNKILSHDYTLQEIYKSTLTCIESILLHLEQDNDFEISAEYLESTGKVLIKFIYNFKQNEIQDNDFMTISTLTINSLKFICQSSTNFTTDHVGELIGISKAFMMYGLTEIYQPPTKVMSSQQAIMEPISEPKCKKNLPSVAKKKTTKSKNVKKSDGKNGSRQKNEENPYQQFTIYRTSDSDFSDNEHSRELVNRNKQVKLRLSALTLLFVISNEVEKRIIFGYWHCLMSCDDTVAVTLGNSILKDSSPRCRIVALQTMIQLLKISKPFLIQAENKEVRSTSTFTPFSVTLGNMIAFNYEILTQALIKEGDFTVLTQILKCISIFITVTPFHRLKNGIVSGFIKFVRILLRHKDPTIKVAALIVIKNLISLPEMTSEILEIVEIPKSKIEFNWRKIDESLRTTNPKEEDELIDMEFEVEEDEEIDEGNIEEPMSQLNITSTRMPWLLQTILENLGIYKGILKLPSIALSVRIESLQVLAAMSSHYLLLKDHLLPISMALSRSLHDATFDEKFHASRALEFIGSSINNFLSQDTKTQQDMDLSLAFWIRTLPNVFQNIQDINQAPTFRASLADSLSNIGVHNFEKLDFMKQTQLKSILTGCCYDEDVNVRSSAVRALSLYVLFPSLREDLCFIENTIESVLRIIKDQNLLSRTKSSFGLANIVDSLLIIKDTVAINENLQIQIVESCLNAASDNDRVKVNVFRALGNSILLVTRKQFDTPKWQNIFERSIEALNLQLSGSSGAKVRWNICHALSTIMKNLSVFDDDLKKKWQSTVYRQLNSIIKNSPNFKVRTNACIALMTPKERSHYGEYFIDIWNCLLTALEQSNNLTDFNEYKHRDALQDQLCLALSHFLNLTTIDDVNSMKKCLFPLIDVTKQNWNRVINRVPPEQQSELLKACSMLKILEGNCKNSEQKNSVEFLVSCFKPIEQFW